MRKTYLDTRASYWELQDLQRTWDMLVRETQLVTLNKKGRIRVVFLENLLISLGNLVKTSKTLAILNRYLIRKGLVHIQYHGFTYFRGLELNLPALREWQAKQKLEAFEGLER